MILTIVPVKAGQIMQEESHVWKTRRDAEHVMGQIEAGIASWSNTWTPKKVGFKVVYDGWAVIEETKNEWGDISP